MNATLRVGMIGAGWWATAAHLPALAAHSRVRLVAVCDADRDLAQSAAEQFGADIAAVSLDDIVDRVDAVVIATPHTTHYGLGVTALTAGLHALIEKPLTTKAADAWHLVNLAREKNVVLAGGSTYQYQDTIPRIRDAVQNRIGELVAINGDFSSSTGVLYAVSSEESVTRSPGKAHGPTYSDPALSGGGQGQTQLSHLMGSAVYLSGRQVLEISAFMENRGLSVDVANALTMTFEGDVLGVASSVGTMPQGVPGRHRLRFHGTAGMLEYDMLAAEAWLFTEGGAAEWIRHDATLPAYPRFAPVDGFVSTILDGTPNRAPGDLAAAAVSAIDAAYEAARTGARVSVHQGTITTPEG